MRNDIWQYHGLDLVDINGYSRHFQNIPHGSRDMASFTFSEFGPQQSLDQWQMIFGKPLGLIVSKSMCMQNFVNIFHTVQELGPVSLFFRSFTSEELRPMVNGIWQSPGLYLVNINVYAKFHKKIPLRSRNRKVLLFQNLDLGKASIVVKWYLAIFGLQMVNINVYVNFYQHIRMIQGLGPVSFFFFFSFLRPTTNLSFGNTLG